MAVCTSGCRPLPPWRDALNERVTPPAYPDSSRAVLASDPSVSSWTGASTPRARSRPKSRGMTSAPRAESSAKASSGLRSGGQAMIRNVREARKRSMRSRDAGESSKSCTISGRSWTMKASDCPISVSCMSGRNRASATASRSRVSCFSSFRTCARMRIAQTSYNPSVFIRRRPCLASAPAPRR